MGNHFGKASHPFAKNAKEWGTQSRDLFRRLFRFRLVVVAFVAVVLAVAMVLGMAIVVFAVPMSLVELPALLVVVIVGMIPVGSLVGRTVPASLDPAVVVAIGGPISLYPGVAGAGHWSTFLVAEGRWRRSDVDRNLG